MPEQGPEIETPARRTLFKAGALALSVGCLAVLMAFGQGAIGCGADPSASAEPGRAAGSAPASATAASTTTAGAAALSADESAAAAASTAARSSAPPLDGDYGGYFPASKAGPPTLHRRTEPQPAQQLNAPNPK